MEKRDFDRDRDYEAELLSVVPSSSHDSSVAAKKNNLRAAHAGADHTRPIEPISRGSSIGPWAPDASSAARSSRLSLESWATDKEDHQLDVDLANHAAVRKETDARGYIESRAAAAVDDSVQQPLKLVNRYKSSSKSNELGGATKASTGGQTSKDGTIGDPSAKQRLPAQRGGKPVIHPVRRRLPFCSDPPSEQNMIIGGGFGGQHPLTEKWKHDDPGPATQAQHHGTRTDATNQDVKFEAVSRMQASSLRAPVVSTPLRAPISLPPPEYSQETRVVEKASATSRINPHISVCSSPRTPGEMRASSISPRRTNAARAAAAHVTAVAEGAATHHAAAAASFTLSHEPSKQSQKERLLLAKIRVLLSSYLPFVELGNPAGAAALDESRRADDDAVAAESSSIAFGPIQATEAERIRKAMPAVALRVGSITGNSGSLPSVLLMSEVLEELMSAITPNTTEAKRLLKHVTNDVEAACMLGSGTAAGVANNTATAGGMWRKLPSKLSAAVACRCLQKLSNVFAASNGHHNTPSSDITTALAAVLQGFAPLIQLSHDALIAAAFVDAPATVAASVTTGGNSKSRKSPFELTPYFEEVPRMRAELAHLRERLVESERARAEANAHADEVGVPGLLQDERSARAILARLKTLPELSIAAVIHSLTHSGPAQTAFATADDFDSNSDTGSVGGENGTLRVFSLAWRHALRPAHNASPPAVSAPEPLITNYFVPE